MDSASVLAPWTRWLPSLTISAHPAPHPCLLLLPSHQPHPPATSKAPSPCRLAERVACIRGGERTVLQCRGWERAPCIRERNGGGRFKRLFASCTASSVLCSSTYGEHSSLSSAANANKMMKHPEREKKSQSSLKIKKHKKYSSFLVILNVTEERLLCSAPEIAELCCCSHSLLPLFSFILPKHQTPAPLKRQAALYPPSSANATVQGSQTMDGPWNCRDKVYFSPSLSVSLFHHPRHLS